MSEVQSPLSVSVVPSPVSTTPTNRYAASGKARAEAAHQRHLSAGISIKRHCSICFPGWRQDPKATLTKPLMEETLEEARVRIEKTLVAGFAPSFKDRVMALAKTGRSAIEAATIVGMELRQFLGEVQTEFKATWGELLYQNHILFKHEMLEAAQRAAKKGDWRPMTLLDKLGWVPVEVVRDEPEEDLSKLTTEELEKRVNVKVRKVREVVERPNRFGEPHEINSTVEVVEGGELPKDQKPWVYIPPDSDEKQAPVVEVKPAEAVPEPAPVEEENKPAVYYPPGGKPLIPHVVRGYDGTPRTGEGR